MELLYPTEHLSCYNYHDEQKPIIEPKLITKGQAWNIEVTDHKIIFIVDGILSFSYGQIHEEEVSKGKMIMVTSGNRFQSHAKEDTRVTIFRLRTHIQLCDRFSLEHLLKDTKESAHKHRPLEMNSIVWGYINTLNSCVSDGLKCFYFFEAKLKEFFFFLRAYYTKEDLVDFFYPLISTDTSFSDFILTNHHRVRTVKELAYMFNCSLSGFEKRFKRVFGISAGQWMKQQRAMSIYHLINSTTSSFKRISIEHGFSSPAHFNDFCKTQFGATPGIIRKQNAESQINFARIQKESEQSSAFL